MGRYALLIGISNYNAGLTPLPSAVKDVDALQQVLLNREIGGFAKSDVTVLRDAEKGAIETAIYHLFANKNNNDLLLFYFSGHGVTDSRSDFYFTGLSTTKDALPPTAVSSNYVHNLMNQSRSKRQVVILDCCHSGAFSKGATIKDIGTVNVLPKLGGEGRAILTASDSSQYAFAQEGFELSLYTHFLVEGLKTGAADRDGDGDISVDELYDYVRDKVKSTNDNMSPEFHPVKEGYRIVLAKAAQDDPKLKFRKEVEIVVGRSNGKISPVARNLLNAKSQAIDPLEVEAIIGEVLRPYHEYAKKLENYEQTLLESIAEEFPFSEVVQYELQEYENHLGLREEDLQAIKARIFKPKHSEYEMRTREKQKQEEEIRLHQQTEREYGKQKQEIQAEQLLKRQQEDSREIKVQQEQIEKLDRQQENKVELLNEKEEVEYTEQIQTSKIKRINFSQKIISRRNFLMLIGLAGIGFLSALIWENVKIKGVLEANVILKIEDSFKKIEASFKSAKSLQDLIIASKSIDETKSILSTVSNNSTERISELKSKTVELDKKIAISLTIEENADKALKNAITKIDNADQANRNPQGTAEQPEDAKKRLNKPKSLYVEAQVLLKSIPDNSFLAINKKEKLKQLTEKNQRFRKQA
jgi:hypothetical protein